MREPALAVIVPTRGRPENIRKVIAAWDFTNAWDVADLILAVDADDPEYPGYARLFEEQKSLDNGGPLFSIVVQDVWRPMVSKLNRVAVALAESRRYQALGFAGDDHLPQTIGWARRYLTVLGELKTGMVYGDDGFQGRKLSTEWAVTADVVRAFRRMVPAPVGHMYCDNSIMDLFAGAGALRHLPEVRIEHMHPIAGKADTDEQYKRVNSREQYARDRAAYEQWQREDMAAAVASLRAMRPGAPEEPPIELVKPVRPASPPRPKNRTPFRSGPTSERIKPVSRFPFSQEFKHVRGATPDEIGMTLADLATGVPADQEIVELGVFQGRTALIMAWGAAQGFGAHVTGVDPWDLEGNVYDPPFTETASRDWARYRIRELGYDDRITLVQAFSHEVAEHWTDQGGYPVGLLFVDGDHTKEGARRDIEVWAPRLAPSATIAVDDYGHPDWPGVKMAVDDLVNEGVLAPLEIFHDRLAVTRLVSGLPQTTAITGEGVSPLPVGPVSTEPGCQHPECILDHPHAGPAELALAAVTVDLGKPDSKMSSEDWAWKVTPEEAVALTVPVGPVADLNTVQLRALAKHRGILLGARKDKRDAMLSALEAGE